MPKITELPQNIPSNQDLVLIQKPTSGFPNKSDVWNFVKNNLIPINSDSPQDTTIAAQGGVSGTIGKNLNLKLSTNKKISIIDQNNNEVAYFDATTFDFTNVFTSTENYARFQNQMKVNLDFRNYTSSPQTLVANKNNFIIINTNQDLTITNILTDQGNSIADGTFVFIKNESSFNISLSTTNFNSSIPHTIPSSDIALCVWRTSVTKWEVCDYKINVQPNIGVNKQKLSIVGNNSGFINESFYTNISYPLNSGNTWTEYLGFPYETLSTFILRNDTNSSPNKGQRINISLTNTIGSSDIAGGIYRATTDGTLNFQSDLTSKPTYNYLQVFINGSFYTSKQGGQILSGSIAFSSGSLFDIRFRTLSGTLTPPLTAFVENLTPVSPPGIQAANQSQPTQTSVLKLNRINLNDSITLESQNNSNIKTGLKIDNLNSSYNLYLPAQLPTVNNQIITTDGTGNLSYKTVDIYTINNNTQASPISSGFIAIDVGNGNEKASIENIVKTSVNSQDSYLANDLLIRPSNNSSGLASDFVLMQSTGTSGNGQISVNASGTLVNYNERTITQYVPKVENIQFANITTASGTVSWGSYDSVVIASGLNQANIASFGSGIEGQNLLVTNKSTSSFSLSDDGSTGGILIPANLPNIVLHPNTSIEFTYTNNKWRASNLPPRKSYLKMDLTNFTQATGIPTKIQNLNISDGGTFGTGLSFDSVNNRLINVAEKPLSFKTCWNMRFGYGSPTTATLPSAVAAERTCYVAINDNVNSGMIAGSSKSMCKNRFNNDTTQTMCNTGAGIFTLNSGQYVSLYAIAPYDGVGPASGFLTSRITPGENLPNSSRFASSAWCIELLS